MTDYQRLKTLRVDQQDLGKQVLFCPACQYQLIGGAHKPKCPLCQADLHLTRVDDLLLRLVRTQSIELVKLLETVRGLDEPGRANLLLSLMGPHEFAGFLLDLVRRAGVELNKV